MSEVFETLNALNVNEHTEKKKTGKAELTYLSWPWAWAEVKKRYPGAHYEVRRFENGLPYTYDPLTGYMVFTSVTIEEVTHEMWLPVMDGTNRAMKSEPYEYVTKYSSGTVAAATMTDINKTIMRCLVKNLAMFGLGLYIYAGEDLPETESDDGEALTKKKKAPEEDKRSGKEFKPAPKKEDKKEFKAPAYDPGADYRGASNNVGVRLKLDKAEIVALLAEEQQKAFTFDNSMTNEQWYAVYCALKKEENNRA